MKKIKKIFIFILVCAFLVSLSSCLNNNSFGEESTENLSAKEVFAYTPQDIFVTEKKASTKDLSNTYSDDYINLDLSSGNVEIIEEGTYMLSGTYENTTITVNVSDEEKVTLLLNNLTVKNNDTAVIYVLNADKVFVNVLDDTSNSLSISSSFAETLEGIDAVIYSKDDLTINGTGTLNITTTDTAIKSKDDLVLSSLTLNVNSESNGIVGKDSLVIASGIYTVTADKDAIKSNGDELDGVVIISKGTFELKAGDDAISATNLILIEEGSFNILSSDDGIISDNDIVINGGTYLISAGDDAISASYDLQVNGGDITVTTCYEGLEGKNVQINEGNINIISTDDGINASYPTDSDVEESNDPDGNYHSSSEEIMFSMFGGTIYIDTKSDGVDSNGNIYIDGGDLTISGAETNAENPMDYNLNAVIVSGNVVSIGYSGMAQNFTNSDTNVSVMYNFILEEEGSTVSITSSEGTVLYSYTLKKSASSVLISTNLLKSDTSYIISVGESSEEFNTSTSNIVTLGTASSNNAPGQFPGKR